MDLSTPGGIVVSALEGIGRADAIETDVNRVDAVVTGVGGMMLNEADAVRLERLQTNDGSVDVTAGGTVSIGQVVSSNAAGIDDANGLGVATNVDIAITATGDFSDIVVTGLVDANSGADVRLVAGDDVTTTGTALVRADDLAVVSTNRSADSEIAVSMATEVNDLELEVSGQNRGGRTDH